tara:strand:+ start:319 stop:579 length:261 start_codon:yes stop_codon:yes gene_type:complete
MIFNDYKFKPGDLIVTSTSHAKPGCLGILVARMKEYGTVFWEIYWFTEAPSSWGGRHGETELNLFNLREQYHFYNNQGEYYVNENC